MAKNGWVVPISLVLGVLLFGYILGRVPMGEAFGLLGNAQLHFVFIYLAAQLGRLMSFTLSWLIILRSQGAKVPYLSLLNYRITDYAISFLTPGPKVGGEFTRASLLEKEHGLDYSKALSSSAIDKLMEGFSNALFLMLGVLVVTILVSMSLGWKIFLYFVSVLVVLLLASFFVYMAKGKSLFHSIFTFFRLDRFSKMKKVEEGLRDFESHMQGFYSKERKGFFLALLATMPAWILSFVEFHYLLLMLGLDLPLEELFLIFNLIGLTYLIPVPLALGTLEASQISVFALLKEDTNVGVMVAMITRIRDLLLSAWGLSILGYHGLKVKEVFEKYFRD